LLQNHQTVINKGFYFFGVHKSPVHPPNCANVELNVTRTNGVVIVFILIVHNIIPKRRFLCAGMIYGIFVAFSENVRKTFSNLLLSSDRGLEYYTAFGWLYENCILNTCFCYPHKVILIRYQQLYPYSFECQPYYRPGHYTTRLGTKGRSGITKFRPVNGNSPRPPTKYFFPI